MLAPAAPARSSMATNRPVSIVNPANMVTASRFLTLPPFYYFVSTGAYQLVVAVVLVCSLLDKLDGLVAKLFDCRSEFGAVLDAVADGFCYGFFIIVLASHSWVPWLPVVLIVALGVTNLVFRIIYARRVGRGPTNYKSYAMERVVAWAAYLGGFGAAGYSIDYFYWGCVVVLAVVVIHDGKRMAFDPVEPVVVAA